MPRLEEMLGVEDGDYGPGWTDTRGRVLQRRDQYGEIVKMETLVLLEPGALDLDNEEIDVVMNAKWYKFEHSDILLVNVDEVKNLFDSNPLDADLDVYSGGDLGPTLRPESPLGSFLQIECPLHRWNETDGFFPCLKLAERVRGNGYTTLRRGCPKA